MAYNNLNIFYFRIRSVNKLVIVNIRMHHFLTQMFKLRIYGRNETTEFDKLDLVQLKRAKCIEFRMTHMMKIYNTEK